MRADKADGTESRLDALVREAVSQAHENVRLLASQQKLVARHRKYPVLDHFDSGQPRVSHTQGPVNYAALFTVAGRESWTVSFDDVPALGELGRLAIEDENLRARLLVPGVSDMNESRERWVRIQAAHVPLEILDRLLNTVGDSYTEDDFQQAWNACRNGLLWEKLPVEFVVPVCLTSFDVTDPVKLTDRIRIEPLPEGEQRARMPETIFGGAAHDCVAAAATHAVTIAGHELPGRDRVLLGWGRREFYPIDEIELAFEALRICSSVQLGYAQIYMRPLGWAWHYTADLPPVIEGSFARRYPPSFDHYGWLRAPDVVSRADTQDAGELLTQLQNAPKRIRLASRRFSNAALREEEDDAILDLCIALEAALGDSQRSEMTYKLSVRGASLLALGDETPDGRTILRRMKRLYSWRSAIVHGDDVAKARRAFAATSKGESAAHLATDLVRRILYQLCRRPELHAAGALDEALVFRAGPREDRPDRPESG